jgi:O-antigen biosynthesis protein WbqV
MASSRLGTITARAQLLHQAKSRIWALVLAHDIAMAGASLVIAVYLRVGQQSFARYHDLLITVTPLFMLAAGLTFFAFGMYRGVWRYASLSDLVALAKAVTLSILAFMALLFFIDHERHLPRSAPMIQWFVLIIMVGAPRLSYRLLKSRPNGPLSLGRWAWDHLVRSGPDPREPVLLVGVGSRAALFIRAMEDAPDAAHRPVGILDEGDAHRGRAIHGVPVLGSIEELAPAIARLAALGQRPQRVILTAAADQFQGERLRTLVEQAGQAGLPVARLGQFSDLATAASRPRVELRPIALADLLGRPQVSLDRAAIRALIAGRRVLVTGAGGSIGSELSQQIADYGPARLILSDACEFNLYTVDLKVQERCPEVPRSAILLNVRDGERLEQLFAAHRPELVFHAAALKHVPMVEHHPGEGVLTNVIGTRNVADAVWRHHAEAMVLVSTDKAVNPTSMMGATKRLAEFYCQALDFHGRLDAGAGRARPRFITVRFGNVLGSSGSVVPLFEHQIAQGGPLTITHPEVERYFMTIQEAVELVLQASAHGLAHRDERGWIYVLDMGKPIRVADIARQLIRLHGQRPDLDVKLHYVGLRAGEKLHEELFDAEERQVPVIDGVLAAHSRLRDLRQLKAACRALARSARSGDRAAMTRLVGAILPSYRPDDRRPAPPPACDRPAERASEYAL